MPTNKKQRIITVHKVFIVISIVCLCFLFSHCFVNSVFADSDGNVETIFFGNFKDDGQGCGVYMILNYAIDFLTFGIGIAAIFGITLSGITYLTAGGNEEKTTKAKRRISEIVIGLVVYVALWSILNLFLPGGVFYQASKCGINTSSNSSSKTTSKKNQNQNGKTSAKSTNNEKTTSKSKSNSKKLSIQNANGELSEGAQKIAAAVEKYASKFQATGIRYGYVNNNWSSWSNIKKTKRAICHSLTNVVAKEVGIIKTGGEIRLDKGKIIGKRFLNKNKIKLIRENVNTKISTLVKNGALLPGDIIGSQESDHSMIYKGYKNGKYYFYNTGRFSTDTRKKGGKFIAKKILGSSPPKYNGDWKVGAIIRAK